MRAAHLPQVADLVPLAAAHRIEVADLSEELGLLWKCNSGQKCNTRQWAGNRQHSQRVRTLVQKPPAEYTNVRPAPESAGNTDEYAHLVSGLLNLRVLNLVAAGRQAGGRAGSVRG